MCIRDRNSAAANATPYLAAAVALTTPDVPQDVFNNIPQQVLQDVLSWVQDLDLKIRSLPPSQQVYNGKIYVPLNQVNNIDTKYTERVWTLLSNPNWVRQYVQKVLANNVAGRLKPYIERVRTIYKQPNTSVNNPPSTTSTTDRTLPIPTANQKQDDIADIIFKNF